MQWEQRLSASLRALASADVLYNAAVAERLGIGPTDLRCLARLDEVGAATPTDLARWSGLTSGAITGVVNRLEARGLVTRTPSPDDARKSVVRPVPGRRPEIERLMGPLGERLAATLRPLAVEEREVLAEWLDAATREIAGEAARIRHL